MLFKLGTFSGAGRAAPFVGLVLAERVVPLARAVPWLERLKLRLRSPEALLSLLDNWETNFQALAIACETYPHELTQDSIAIDELHIRAPIDPPRQIFCTIANYRSHIVETMVDTGAPPGTAEPPTRASNFPRQSSDRLTRWSSRVTPNGWTGSWSSELSLEKWHAG
jgi:2,4-didehydro-3-deoxy-L-rhamnonate hydrolase